MSIEAINCGLSARPILEWPPVTRVSRDGHSVELPETIQVTMRPFPFAYDTCGRAHARYIPHLPQVTISAQEYNLLLKLIEKQKSRKDVFHELPALLRV